MSIKGTVTTDVTTWIDPSSHRVLKTHSTESNDGTLTINLSSSSALPGLTGPVTIKGTGTLSGCTDKANTGGSGKFVANTKKSPYSAVITWKGTGTTTTSLKYSSPTKSICPKGTSEIVITGTVTGGTKAAIKSIPKNSKVSAIECYDAKAKPAVALTLAKKQLFHI